MRVVGEGGEGVLCHGMLMLTGGGQCCLDIFLDLLLGPLASRGSANHRDWEFEELNTLMGRASPSPPHH